MPKFESPISNKGFVGQPMKEFVVPDESDQLNQGPSIDYNNTLPVMRARGPSLHGAQPPVNFEAAMAFQNRMDNESQEDAAETERQIRAARDAKRTGKERLNDGARRRIEMLVGMTQNTREVVLDGNVFILQTLKSKDMREALMAASVFDGTIQSPFEIRKQLLARSITQIAGVESGAFVGSNGVEAKLDFIDEQVEAVLNRLYSEYLILVKESNDKYSIKTSEDATQVVEDLKK